MSSIQSRIRSLGTGASQEKPLEKRVPTVFIALGGSGKDVVTRLRKRFFDRFHTKDPGFAQFVYIDTDTQKFVPEQEKPETFTELAPHQNELVAVPITPEKFNRTFTALNTKVNSDHLSWLKRDMEQIGPQSVEHGAGTYRPMGRLAFYLNYIAIRGTIERQIDAALQFAARNSNTVEENRLEVLIVFSLTGGTGSGMFIDVAYLVQDILNQKYPSLKGRSVTLIGFLPGVFEDQDAILERLQQNAFAAFMELEQYGTPRTGDELFLGEIRNGTHASQNWTGFLANWGDGKKKFIRGPGWDTCFLIDNRNDLDAHAPLSRREVFQMAADYLFLDFENHQFAIAKRSARCNLVQFKDRIKETWVRRPDNPNESSQLIEGNSVYATQNGCRFSSFGLSEIYFDVEMLYQIAAYRLAARLVRSRWIGTVDRYPESQYTAWVKDQLFQPKADAAQAVPPSFLPESLTRRMLTATSGGSHLDDLKRDLDALAEKDPEEGLDELSRRLAAHSASIRGDGASKGESARQSLQANLTRLSGDAGNLGPLRTRLRQLASLHCGQFGVAATLGLLDKWRDAIAKVRDRARQQGAASPPDDHALLARLTEAARVPWPVTKTAVAIEFDRTRATVGKAIQLRYDKAAATSIDRLLMDVSKYIGEPNQPYDPGLARHGTLHGYYTQAQTFLKGVAERLEARFSVAYHDHLPSVDTADRTRSGQPSTQSLKPRFQRRHSISPKWDEPTFDRRIDEALVGHPDIKKADGAVDGFNFDWKKFEDQVLAQLRALPRGDLAEINNLDNLITYCNVNGHMTEDGKVLIADLLTEACKIVLHGAKDASGNHGGGFQLREEGEGNAIDLLLQDADWAEALEKLVKASMPYFQSINPSRISNDFSPAYYNLYSQKQGSIGPSATNATRVFHKVRDVVGELAANIPNQSAKEVSAPLPSENSTIILVREMTGFPLQFYAHLNALRASYDKAITKVGNMGSDVAHINYNEASENLPDITLLDDETYASIREHVTYVLRAIILGTINWKEDVLKVSVPDQWGQRHFEMRLGKHLHRAIKYACDNERVRKHLVSVWNDWANRASPCDWACLYASGRMSWSQLRPEPYVRQGVTLSPMVTCYQEITSLAEGKLKATDEGRRWLAQLEGDAFQEEAVEELSDVAANRTFAQRLVRTCLRRLNPEVPIYQILHDKVTDLESPA